jgi:hypothetical protein
MNDQAEEISVEELFRELCARGRDYVTVKDIKKWDYLQELMKVIGPRSVLPCTIRMCSVLFTSVLF